MSGNDWHRLDESDVRIRPGKGSRPRSKRRPDHAEASAAMVVGVDRGRWTCAVDEDPNHLVTAMRARHPSIETEIVPDQGHAPILSGGDLIDRVARFVAACETKASALAAE